MTQVRADQLLVARGLAPSRTLAQRLIAAGRVRAATGPVRKPAEALDAHALLELTPGDEDLYVSRAGLKLAGALRASGFDPSGVQCLDVGQSTGGFTDCLLQAGAARVVGVDVGHGQLHERLHAHPRVVAFEGINARSIDAAALGSAMPAGGFALVVVDVSFISLERVLPALAPLGAPGATLIALVKPQFEVGRANLNRHGIVRDETLYPQVRARIERAAADAGWAPRNWLESPITGSDGNREFFVVAGRASKRSAA